MVLIKKYNPEFIQIGSFHIPGIKIDKNMQISMLTFNLFCL